ncbi:MAG: hypothetical protein ACHQIG_03880 [Acidimicrobiia bacterium]
MPTKTTEPTAVITELFVTGIKQSQELAAAGVSAWVDFAGKAFTMPSVDALPAGFPTVDPQEIIDVSFGLAEEVLATQKQLVTKVLEAVTPKPAKSA